MTSTAITIFFIHRWFKLTTTIHIPIWMTLMTRSEHRDKATNKKKNVEVRVKKLFSSRSCGLGAISSEKCFLEERSLFP